MLINPGDLIPVRPEAIHVPWTKRKSTILNFLHRGQVTFRTYVYDTNVGDISPLSTYFNPKRWSDEDLNNKFGVKQAAQPVLETLAPEPQISTSPTRPSPPPTPSSSASSSTATASGTLMERPSSTSSDKESDAANAVLPRLMLYSATPLISERAQSKKSYEKHINETGGCNSEIVSYADAAKSRPKERKSTMSGEYSKNQKDQQTMEWIRTQNKKEPSSPPVSSAVWSVCPPSPPPCPPATPSAVSTKDGFVNNNNPLFHSFWYDGYGPAWSTKSDKKSEEIQIEKPSQFWRYGSTTSGAVGVPPPTKDPVDLLSPLSNPGLTFSGWSGPQGGTISRTSSTSSTASSSKQQIWKNSFGIHDFDMGPRNAGGNPYVRPRLGSTACSWSASSAGSVESPLSLYQNVQKLLNDSNLEEDFTRGKLPEFFAPGPDDSETSTLGNGTALLSNLTITETLV